MKFVTSFVEKMKKAKPITDPDLIEIPKDGFTADYLSDIHYYTLQTISKKLGIEHPPTRSRRDQEMEVLNFDYKKAKV